MRDDESWRESRRSFLFPGPGCVCTRAWQVDTVNCLSFVDLSAILLTSLASNGAVHVRGGVIKCSPVVDNDTTVHAVHIYTVAFCLWSSSCVVSVITLPLTHALQNWLKAQENDSRHMTHSHLISSFFLFTLFFFVFFFLFSSHLSLVTCHLSLVTSHFSLLTAHFSLFFYFLLFYFFLLCSFYFLLLFCGIRFTHEVFLSHVACSVSSQEHTVFVYKMNCHKGNENNKYLMC